MSDCPYISNCDKASTGCISFCPYSVKHQPDLGASMLIDEIGACRKIGQEEQRALEQVLNVLDHFPRSNELYDSCKILRAFLESKP